MNILKILVPAAVCATALGCATARGPGVAKMLGETTRQNGRACIWLYEIQSYGVLKGNIISINTLHQDYYLATVLPGCNDLRTSVRTLFKGRFSEICGQSMDAIATAGDHCVINKIYKFENREQAFAAYNAARDKRKELKNHEPGG